MTTTVTISEMGIDFTKSQVLESSLGEVLLSVANSYDTVNAGKFSGTFLYSPTDSSIVGTQVDIATPSSWTVINGLLTMTFEND